MSDQSTEYQSLQKAPDFQVHHADGYVTLPLWRLGNERTIQINFWIVEGAPQLENNQLPYDNPEHYKLGLSHTIQTAVRVNPAIAYALARTLLSQLAAFPEDVKARYGVPEIPALEGLKI
ncbi:MAG TPA: hypothetical protein VMU06_07965 [Stellaceae bacterium]|nr:hypothetical protein [Stellaceae bacterium]